MARAATVRSAGFLGAASSAVLGLLPKLTCPVCWPAYSAVLAALGVEFFDYTPYLLPITATFIAAAIAALAWKARLRHSILPVAIGIVAGSLLLLGKFVLDTDVIAYAGAGLFLVAPFLPMRASGAVACTDCDRGQIKEVG